MSRRQRMVFIVMSNDYPDARFFYNYAPAGCFRRGALSNWKGILK